MLTNVRSVRLAIAGTDSGSMIRRQMPHSDSPSMRAASLSDSGIDSKYCFMRKTPNAPNAWSSRIDHSVLASPKSDSMTNCGIMYDCHGTAMVPM